MSYTLPRGDPFNASFQDTYNEQSDQSINIYARAPGLANNIRLPSVINEMQRQTDGQNNVLQRLPNDLASRSGSASEATSSGSRATQPERTAGTADALQQRQDDRALRANSSLPMVAPGPGARTLTIPSYGPFAYHMRQPTAMEIGAPFMAIGLGQSNSFLEGHGFPPSPLTSSAHGPGGSAHMHNMQALGNNSPFSASRQPGLGMPGPLGYANPFRGVPLGSGPFNYGGTDQRPYPTSYWNGPYSQGSSGPF